MKMAKPTGRLLTALCAICTFATFAGAAHGEEAACHVIYGGETKVVRVAETETPYTVPAVKFGSFFRFRAVVDTGPLVPDDLAAFKTYVYAEGDDAPALIHQGVFPWPVVEGPAQRFGFTGLHRVYEPDTSSELEFWCSVVDLGEGRE